MVTEGIDLKKRIFCMILALALILGLAPGVLAAETGDGTKTITAQPSAAAADAPAALPEHEPLKNVTGAEPEDVVTYETPKVACVFFTGRNYPPDYYTSIEDAFNAACKAIASGGITVQLLDDVTMLGDFSLTAQFPITLDLNGHTIRGAKLKLGQGTTTPYALHIADSTTGQGGAIDEIVLCSYYCDLYLDGAVSTTINKITFDTTQSVKVEWAQGYVAEWSFGTNNSASFLSFLASGSHYYAYEDGQLGQRLDNSKNEYETYGSQGKMAAVRCPHETVHFDITSSCYVCDLCNLAVREGALLTKADGTSKYYADQTAALAAAQASADSTLKLLGDFVGQITLSTGNFTLDLNGRKLSSTDYPTLKLTGTANLTLINTSDTQAEILCSSSDGSACTAAVDGADAHLQVGNTDGTNKNIRFGAPKSGPGLRVIDGTVRLYGGQYSGIQVTKTGGKLLDLLPNGWALADHTGTTIVDLSDPSQSTKNFGTLFVVTHPCNFTSSGKCACGRPCTHPNVRPSGICDDCGQNHLNFKLILLDGTAQFFLLYNDAVKEAQKLENSGCTLTVLHADLGLGDKEPIATDNCSFTLDLNGYNLNGGVLLFPLTGKNQNITIRNSGAAATLSAGTFVSMSSGSTVTFDGSNITFEIQGTTDVTGTMVEFAADATAEMKVVINGGAYEKDANSTDNFRLLDIDRPNASVEINAGVFTQSVYVSNGGKLRVTGGTFGNDDTRYAVNVSNGGTLRVAGDSSNPKFEKVLRIEDATADVKLSGGRYKEIYYGGYSGKGSHLELLENRYAFYGYNGSLINTAAEVGGESLTYRGDEFYVARHDRHDPQPEDDGRCVCGYLCPHEDMSDDALWCSDCGMQYVVTTKNGTKTTHHTRLKYAMQAAEDGATITLLGTTVLGDQEVPVSGKTVTINLNGQTISEDTYLPRNVIKIASDGAVKFTGNGTVNATVELDSGISAENNKTAFLGGTFAEIRCTNPDVLPALARANKFAFRNGGWLTIGQLGASSLTNVTAYPLPFWITKMPTDGEIIYGDTMLPEALRPEFELYDPDNSFGYLDWKYGENLETMLACVNKGPGLNTAINNKIQVRDLPVGTYHLTLVPKVETNPGVYFTPYETMPTATLTVKQQAATVTKAPEPATGLIFDGQQHALLSNGGTAEGGTMVFAPAENGTYMEGIPSGSGAGTYTIWYKVDPDGNHSETTPAYVEVTIAPCQLRAQVEDKTMYAGDQLPAFTATYSGFAGSDTAESIVQADTAVFHTDATGRQTGKFDITMTAAPTLNGSNYELKLSAVTKGTLTVNERPRMPKLPKDDGEKTPESPFDDVTQDDYFFDPVRWAVDEEIAQGVGGGRFAPHAPCTRAQIVTMLWRAAGSPEPKGTAGFADVPAGAYYAKAVAWAAEQGIAAGVGGGKFDPHAPCTRAQAVTLLHRAAGAPDTEADAPFADVPTTAYYKEAVAWATEAGITTGVGDGKFAPDATCTRAQIVTMLYRYFKK